MRGKSLPPLRGVGRDRRFRGLSPPANFGLALRANGLAPGGEEFGRVLRADELAPGGERFGRALRASVRGECLWLIGW